jgi:hypothetical protein
VAYHLLTAVLGIVGLMAVWLGVQSLARRQGPGDCDGPEPMACNSCAPERAGTCGMKLVDSDTE